MAIADKLNDLITQRNNLADNLNTMGVSASQAEKLSTLVPKVLNIQSTPTEITKGIIINECDDNGFVTDASVVGITKIPDYYFHYAAYASGSYKGWLSSIGSNLHLPETLTEIGQLAFNNCTNLAITSLPENLTKIGQSAFGYCSNLALTSLPETLTEIGNGAFGYCSNLALTSLPSGITSIAYGVFNNCVNLALTSLPENLTEIGQLAFSSCTNLAITSLPSGITKLDSNVFYRCTSLKELTISGNITSIGNNALYYCSNLTKIVMPNITAVPTLSNTNALLYTPISMRTGYIYVPDDLVASFQSASNWSNYASQIKGISELEG